MTDSNAEMMIDLERLAERAQNGINPPGWPHCCSGRCFDALTSKCPYKDAWQVEKAVDLIKEESGDYFAPE